MIKRATAPTKFFSPENIFGSLGVIVSLALVVLGAVGLILIQKPITEKQDLRQQASVAGGQVFVTTSAAPSPLTVGQPATITIYAATPDIGTDVIDGVTGVDGIELVFNITSTANLESLGVVGLTSSGMEVLNAEQDSTSGLEFLTHLTMTAPGMTGKFNTDTPVAIATITFIPTQAGTVTFDADVANSIATGVVGGIVVDLLQNIETFSYQVAAPATACTYTYGDWGSCTAGQLTRTYTAAPADCTQTPSPFTTQSCITGCSYNPSNATIVCPNISVPDCVQLYGTGYTYVPGTNDLCGCQTVGQCVGPNVTVCQYTYSSWSSCLNNQQTRTYVAQPADCTQVVAPTITQSCDSGTGGLTVVGCNELCTTNDECPVNTRCYDLGSENRCRLVTNLASTTCQEASNPDNGLDFGCNHWCADSTECSDEFVCQENYCRRPDNPADQYCRAPSQQITSAMSSLCNRSCQTNNDCAVNLACYSGQCRLVTNPTSTTCSTTRTKIVTNTIYVKKPTTITKKGADTLTSPRPTPVDTGVSTGATGSAAVRVTPSPTTSPKPDTAGSTVPLEKRSAWQELVGNLQAKLDDMGISLPLLMIGLGIGLIVLFLAIMLLKKLFGSSDDEHSPDEFNQPPSSQIHNLQQRISTLQQQQQQPSPRPVAQPMSQYQPSPPSSSMMTRVQDRGLTPRPNLTTPYPGVTQEQPPRPGVPA